jgi:hypothetical protein
MKNWALVLFLVSSVLTVKSQDNTKISLDVNNVSLLRVLGQVQNQAGVTFAYKNSLIQGEVVKVKFKNVSLKDGLELLFRNSDIGFTIKKNKVLLFKKLKDTEQHTLSGFIVDSISGEPLIGATLYSVQQKVGARADANGYFSLTLSDGVYDFLISYTGFKQLRLKKKVVKDVRLDISLQRKSSLKPVIITEKSDDNLYEDQIALKSKAMNALPSIGGEADVIRTMQLMPGIKSGTENASGLFVRGGAPEENLVLLDGIPIYKPTHLFGFLSIFNSDILNKVELSKGGFKARYGGRLSSVLNISMKNGNIKQNSISASLNPLVSKILIQGPIKKDKGSFIMSYRRSFTDLYLNNWRTTETFYGSDSNRSRFSFYDFNAKVNYKINKKNRVFLSVYNGEDSYNRQDISRDSTFQWRSVYDNNLNFSNQLVSGRWQKIYNQKIISNVTLAYSSYRTNTFLENSIVYNNPDVFQYDQQASIADKIVKADISYFINQQNTIRFGIDATNHSFSPENRFRRVSQNMDSTELTAENIMANEFNAYMEDEWQWKKLQLNGGLRATLYNVNGVTYSSVQPRLDAQYALHPKWNLGGSYAQMAQFLHLLTNANIGGAPTDLWILPTENIKPQRSRQFSARVHFMPSQSWLFTLEGYHKKLSQLIAYKEGASLTQNSIAAVEKITTGSGEAQGAEFLVRKKKGKTTGWIGYTLSKTTRQFDAINNGKSYPFLYDSRHDASVVLMHNFSKRLSLSTSWVYSSGTPISIPSGRYAVGVNQGVNPDFNTPQNIYYGARNNARLQDYHRWDINLNYTIPTSWGQHSFHLNVYNIYNRFNTVFISRQLKVFNDKLFEEYKENALFPIVPTFTYKIVLNGKEK